MSGPAVVRAWIGPLKRLGDRVVEVVYLGCFIRCFREYGVDIALCYGPSMLPTFNARGDLLLSEFYSVYTDGLQIGDVVMARSPQNPKDMICKRVLGLGGDDVVVVPAYGTSPKTVVRVPRGHVWLQGDNTINSTDSRTYGPVPYALLRGRAFLKIWPFREAGWIERKKPHQSLT